MCPSHAQVAPPAKKARKGKGRAASRGEMLVATASNQPGACAALEDRRGGGAVEAQRSVDAQAAYGNLFDEAQDEAQDEAVQARPRSAASLALRLCVQRLMQ